MFLAGWEEKIQFWVEFGQSSLGKVSTSTWTDRVGETPSLERYLCSLLWNVHYRYDGSLFYYAVYVILYVIYIMLLILNFVEP
jgi:hypothetical protein